MQPITGTILAIDPGGNVGVAMRTPHGEYVTLTIPQIDRHDVYDYLMLEPQYVVLEAFTPYQRIDHNMIQVIEMVGGVTAICRVKHIPLTIQTPAARKAYVKQAERLAREFHTIHEVDALAHLLRFIHASGL